MKLNMRNFNPEKTYTHNILPGTARGRIRLIEAQALILTLRVPQKRRNES